MFQRIARERRKKGWKSRRKWQKAQRIKRREEERLRKSREYATPDHQFNVDGVVVSVHELRNRFRGPVEYRFEFHRKDGPNKQLASDFGDQDLDVLIKAITISARYREIIHKKREASQRGNTGITKFKPSKARTLPRAS